MTFHARVAPAVPVVSIFRSFCEPLVAAARAGSWESFVESLRTPLEADIPKKDLPLWSPAQFDGARSIETVHDIWAHVLDVDEAPIPDAAALREALTGIRSVCYSSSSATAESPRWRAALALSRPVTADEYARLASVVIAELPFAVGNASRDPSRQWYFPRVGSDGYYECFSTEGEPLDVEALLEMAPAVVAGAAATPKTGTPREAQHYPGDVTDAAERDRRRALYSSYLRDEAPARGPERRGQGDQILFNVVQRGAYDLALPVDDVLELVREHYNPRCSPMWGDELEERVHHKAHDAKTNSTRPRAEPLPADLAHLATPGAPSLEKTLTELVANRPEDIPIGESDTPAPNPEVDAIEEELKITWGRWDEPLPTPVYMIKPIVPEATLGLIVAKGSSLKTWLVVSMLASVARGEPWLGCFDAQQSPTLLVDFESGRDIIHERVHYLRKSDTPGMGIASFPTSRIDDQAFWIKLAKIVVRRGIKLVAIDSFAAGATGVEENDAAAADPLHFASRFIDFTRCSVVLIHHAKKGDGGDERDLVRGSGAVYGAADWVYTMVPQDEDRTKMAVRCIKAFRKKTDDFRIALTVDGLVLDRTETAADEMTKAQQRILATVRAVPGLITLNDIARAAKAKSGVFTKDDVASLVGQRKMVMLPGRGYCVDTAELRRARVLEATKTPGLSTPQALANAAHVHVDEVHALATMGEIVRSGTGFVAVGD